MEALFAIFPGRRKWPPAVDDVANAPLDAAAIRLVSAVQGIERLPSYGNLKHLWCFNVNQVKLDTICGCESLESLYIENIKAETLDPLQRLPKLKVLGLESCSKIASLAALGNLQSLWGLAIIHFKNVHDLAPLSSLKTLRALAVAGSMWTRMNVDTFAPLAALENLELLHLTNMKADDESLRALAELKRLKELDIANFYPMSEFAWLSQRLKATHCTWFQPCVEMKNSVCKRCGKPPMVILTGSRKPLMVCKRCGKEVLEQHMREWKELTRDLA